MKHQEHFPFFETQIGGKSIINATTEKHTSFSEPLIDSFLMSRVLS